MADSDFEFEMEGAAPDVDRHRETVKLDGSRAVDSWFEAAMPEPVKGNVYRRGIWLAKMADDPVAAAVLEAHEVFHEAASAAGTILELDSLLSHFQAEVKKL